MKLTWNKKPLTIWNILSVIAVIAIIVWMITDPARSDIWAFNKEIIKTNIAKWGPLVVMYAVLDNVIKLLLEGSKLEAWLKSMFQ